MAKASWKSSTGAAVDVEGTAEEVAQMLALLDSGARSGSSAGAHVKPPASKPKKVLRKGKAAAGPKEARADDDTQVDIAGIVNTTKTCDEAENIETRILDRTSQVDRILLPLYIVHEHYDNAFGLTSGHVSKITRELGVPVSQPNTSRTLSGTASKYVMGDTVRKKGQAVRYKMSRRGVQYLQSVINNTNADKG